MDHPVSEFAAAVPDSFVERFLVRAPLRGVSKFFYNIGDALDSLLVKRRLARAGSNRADRIPTWTARSELKALLKLAAMCPPGAMGLEIGSYLGASSCYLAAGLARVGGRLICVDTWNNDAVNMKRADIFSEFSRNTAGIKHRLIVIRGRSRDLTNVQIPKPINIIFIDGDHSYEAVRADTEKVAPWLTPDGLLVFHDACTYQGVSRTVGELLATGDWMIHELVDSLICLKRANFRPPPM
jgi:predicted O-methyltransferase YrrM